MSKAAGKPTAKQRAFTVLAEQLLRPPGGGIPTVSAGKGAAWQLQSRHYEILSGGKAPANDAELRACWLESLAAFASTKGSPPVALLGIPLDTGAGIRRGAMYGPRAVRQCLLEMGPYREWLRRGQVVDLGDVYVNPHLLHDDMLSATQKSRSQNEMYPSAPTALRKRLPVSALSQTRAILAAAHDLFPDLRVFIIGGDHSVAWPVSEVIVPRGKGQLAIVQPDAHTDLLSSRLGVKYCFGTWTFHANELLKQKIPKGKPKDGWLVQLGIRQSGRDKKHWESTTGVKQFWAHDINARPSREVVGEIVDHLKARGVTKVYFSNDIDGTDAAEAPATGTPAPQGVGSAFLLEVIEALGANFEIAAADIVEVAPDLAPPPQSEETCRLAAQYAATCLKHMVR